MKIRSSDIVSISEARAKITEMADDVVKNGNEKVLTKNGSSYVALIDAKKLDYYHQLEEEFANYQMLKFAKTGLEQFAAGQEVSEDELNKLLGE